MRHENISVKSGDAPPDRSMAGPYNETLLHQITDSLDQGVIVWSRTGHCVLFNRQVFGVLELDQRSLSQNSSHTDFLLNAQARGEFDDVELQSIQSLFAETRTFQYDCLMPSGRVVLANVRPMRGGGHVVAFTDVSQTRRAVEALEAAREEAELAQNEAAIVLENERARQRQTSFLSKLDEWLQSCKSLNELYDIVSEFMERIMPFTHGQLFIYSNSRDVLDLACQWNTDVLQDHITPDSCWALRRGRRYLYEQEELCFVCDHVREAQGAAAAPERFICVPIVAHGDTVGMLHLEFGSDSGPVQIHDPLKFTARCGEHISMAIANVKLRDELQDQSTRDPLTGLYNRRFFLDALRKVMARTAIEQGNFALMSIDADKFKSFNDDHGHDAGDAVLEAIAQTMTDLDYEGAVACRMGGEEFSILLPNADRTRATAVAEELRTTIANLRVKYVGGPLPKVTVSSGIAIYPTHGTAPQDLIKAADVALYQAKKDGRDCWHVAEGDGMIRF